MELPERTSNFLKLPLPLQIVKEAGSGGYSVVYEVIDPASSRKYALKKVESSYKDGHEKAGKIE